MAILATLFYAFPAFAQQGEMLGVDIDTATRERVIAGAIAKLNELYVFPETAKKMEQALRAHQKKGEYEAITRGDEFARLLTTHLLEASHDKHLGVTFTAVKPPPAPPALGNTRKRDPINCAFTRLEILDGNIAYVKLGGFGPTDACAPTISAAMNFVANADAIIFDLRGAGGGQALTAVFLESYLFDQPTHVNDIWTRSTDTTQQFWTEAAVPGQRSSDVPVFVLTSFRTFSAGEEFAYDLQAQKRATIVGETTGGGAHTTHAQKLDDRFAINVPFGRAINPITKTNWEGVGVQPDVKVPQADALTTAQKLAAEKIASMRAAPR